MGAVGSGSVSFDRAASYYDRTRPISGRALPRLMEVLERELEGRGRALEVGVGTGIVSLPLVERGIPMLGLDLSRPMLDRLREKAGGIAPLPLVQADATAMPFRDDAFGGTVVRHVLHLIPEWERSLEELVRVLRPGSVVLVNHDDYPEPWRSLFDRFVEEAGVGRPWTGLAPVELHLLHAWMESRGAGVRRLEPIREEVDEPLVGFVDGMRDGLFSWTWGVEEKARREAADRVRAWATEELGPLDRARTRETEIAFWAYDLP
jgi:SAM-dependent methyltransferase